MRKTVVLGVTGEQPIDEGPTPTIEPQRDGSAFADFAVRDLRKVICAVQELNHAPSYAEPSNVRGEAR